MMSGDPVRMLAIDPGSVHCGMAQFVGERCVRAWEVKPYECLLAVQEWLDQDALDVLVVENFRLYGNRALNQINSELGTVRVIGALEFIHAWWGTERVKLDVTQMASILDPTKKILKAKKVVSQAKRSKAGEHALSAELHGYHFLLKNKKEIG